MVPRTNLLVQPCHRGFSMEVEYIGPAKLIKRASPIQVQTQLFSTHLHSLYILDCLFRHAVHNNYFLVHIIKMKFSTTLIAFAAAGLASAQLPDVPACSVRIKSTSTSQEYVY